MSVADKAPTATLPGPPEMGFKVGSGHPSVGCVSAAELLVFLQGFVATVDRETESAVRHKVDGVRHVKIVPTQINMIAITSSLSGSIKDIAA